MPIESDGRGAVPARPAGRAGNPRLFALIEGAPKTGRSPTIWAWPQITEYLKVAAQPVAGPWPPHQEPRPDPVDEAGPVAIVEPPRARAATTPSRPAPVAESPVTEAPAAEAPAAGAPAAAAPHTPRPTYGRHRPRL